MLENANGQRGSKLVEPVVPVYFGRSIFLRDATGKLVTMGRPTEFGRHLPQVTVTMVRSFLSHIGK